MLAKVAPGHDDFINEQYAEQIAAILAKWSSELQNSPPQFDSVGNSFAPDFAGTSVAQAKILRLRSGEGLQVVRHEYPAGFSLGKQRFLEEFRDDLAVCHRLLSAEFQVTAIEGNSPGRLHTQVHFEIVGTGPGFYREQRAGEWKMQWQASSQNSFQLVSWQLLGEIRGRSTNPIFVDVSAQVLGRNPSYSEQLLHGNDYWRTVLDGACGIDIYGHHGVSVGDIDNDGLDDLYVCQPAGLPNRLYRNRGDGTFEDITESSGTGVLENTACALLADFSNSGRQDLLVVRTNGPLLFLNQGGSKFRQLPEAFKFAAAPQGTFTGAALADYDRDGWLDIYFCLYSYYQGTDQYKYPLPYYDAENGPPNFLMRNNRDGTFLDVTQQCGLNHNNTRYSFCCSWNDFNNDGWPDLYVVNDFGRKNLYRNNGDGTFTDVAPPTGAEDVGAGMSVCWLDSNNDGAQDLYIANMWTAAGQRISSQPAFQKNTAEPVRSLYRKHAMGNSLLRHDRHGNFLDVTSSAGVAMGRWAWSSDAWDFDHDGFSDLYVTNGMVSGLARDDLNSFFWRQVVANSPNQAKPSNDYEQGWNAINELIRADGTWSGYERNVFCANNGDGTFSDVSAAVGLDFLEDGRAFALADFDHDGRLELVLKNRNAPQLRILKNVMQGLSPSICFHLRGTRSNRDAIGAVITLNRDGSRQTRTLQAGSGFLSQHSKLLHFGLGANTGAVSVSVRWPSGLVQEFFDLPANHCIFLEEETGKFSVDPFQPSWRTDAASSTPEEKLPADIQTWLLAPVPAPDFSLPELSGQWRTVSALRGKAAVLHFWSTEASGWQHDLRTLDQLNRKVQVLAVNLDSSARPLGHEPGLSFPVLRGSDELAAIYNILFRQLFDRHRDLPLPASFLLDESGQIVKVYQGSIDLETFGKDITAIPQTAAERMSKALPFRGIMADTEFRRNYLSYGSIFFQRGYLEPAESSFRQALQSDAASAEALYGIGSVQLKQDKLAEARQTFERVVKLQPSYPATLPNAWNDLGLLATREGRVADAIPFFQEALRVSPDHLVALDNLGNAFRQQKRWDEARLTLEHAVAVGPQDPEANYSLGMVYAQLDDSNRAYEYLQQALRLRPAYPEALNNLGILYLHTNRRNAAVASFEECIRVAPAFDQSYLNLARVYSLEGAQEKARTVLLDLLKLRPDHTAAQELLRQLQ